MNNTFNNCTFNIYSGDLNKIDSLESIKSNQPLPIKIVGTTAKLVFKATELLAVEVVIPLAIMTGKLALAGSRLLAKHIIIPLAIDAGKTAKIALNKANDQAKFIKTGIQLASTQNELEAKKLALVIGYHAAKKYNYKYKQNNLCQ